MDLPADTKQSNHAVWPIVQVVTSDDYPLHGHYTGVIGAKRAVLHVHGTGGNFFWNGFYPAITNVANLLGFSYLASNNRGSGVYEMEKDMPPAGVSLELFEDCLKDIDAWIEFILDKGHTSIVLEGHSFGIGKVTYYMAKGRYKDKIKGVIFLGTNGVYQTQKEYLKKKGTDPGVYLAEAQHLLKAGKPTALLADKYALCGYYPASAQTYANFFTPESNMYRATQMATKEEGGFRHLITVPLLWILGDIPQKEYLFVPFKDAFTLVRSENPHVDIHQLKQCDHGLNGHESEVATIIADFLQRV